MTDEAAIVPVENIRLGMIQVSGPREVVLQATAIAGELAKMMKEEMEKWGTDPAKSDTDGDGFADGYEIIKGFNPKGTGKL